MIDWIDSKCYFGQNQLVNNDRGDQERHPHQKTNSRSKHRCLARDLQQRAGRQQLFLVRLALCIACGKTVEFWGYPNDNSAIFAGGVEKRNRSPRIFALFRIMF